MDSNLYDPKKTTWLNPNIDYLFNSEIIEYDMKDAGFTLIKQYGLLPDEKIRELEKLERGVERHIAVGKLQRDDKEFSNALLNKFAEMRELFMAMNKIESDDIISVKKDAIYTIGRKKRVQFGKVMFAEKNVYSSYVRFPAIHNLELYYSDSQTDIKGMSESAVNRHRLYMVYFLRQMISGIESKDPAIKRKFMRFVMDYKAHTLDDGYYLEFNNLSRNIDPGFNYMRVIIPISQIIMREVT